LRNANFSGFIITLSSLEFYETIIDQQLTNKP
jgi:hypothetical protein